MSLSTFLESHSYTVMQHSPEEFCCLGELQSWALVLNCSKKDIIKPRTGYTHLIQLSKTLQVQTKSLRCCRYPKALTYTLSEEDFGVKWV